MNNILALLLLVLFSILTGCNSSNSGSDDNPGVDVSVQTKYEGLWQTHCLYEEEDNLWIKMSMDFRGDTMSGSLKEFQDDACASAVHDQLDVDPVSFEVLGTVETESGLIADELEFSMAYTKTTYVLYLLIENDILYEVRESPGGFYVFRNLPYIKVH